MRWGVLAAALAALSVAACATPYEHGPIPPGYPPLPTPAPQPAPQPAPAPPRVVEVSELPGWAAEDHDAAFAAWRATCHAARDPAMAELCRRAKAVRETGPGVGRAFFEAFFQAERLAGDGVLTAYFAPIYEARRAPDAEFSAPVRPKPADLALADGGAVVRTLPGGMTEPYPDRAAIEATPIDAPLAWMRPEELFFLQVQGSGTLVFDDGQRIKALYAANNGRPFMGVANPMRDRGLLARDNTSGDAIRQWLAAHRGPEADEIMRLNPRYAFFRLAPDDGKPPVGAANIPLPAGRAVAVDPGFHAMGELLWVDAEAPLLAGAFPAYRRLATALDTGGAIKGEVRADLYLGEGSAAGAEAGRVRHTLRLYRLVPRP
ncbi:MltA domain-containing protein [Phenylobacterium sp.]|uniref:MltA domain-containing protein n=1 Tax=Phenylobacterium sp. TaxID=1871053 RepID=UPI0025ECC617|nr:MltA domain-containing protein [Phenylobacterium sp.]